MIRDSGLLFWATLYKHLQFSGFLDKADYACGANRHVRKDDT